MFLSLLSTNAKCASRVRFIYGRMFSTKRDVVHSYFFDNDPAAGQMDPSEVKIPYLRDEVKQEMYAKYMEDQVKYSFERLSKQYKATLIRTKAVIYLMKKRNDVISRDEATLWKLSGISEEDCPAPRISAKPVFTVPPIFEKFYAYYSSQAAEKPALTAAIAAYNESCTDDSQHIKLGEKDAQQMLQIIESHNSRRKAHEAYLEEMDLKEYIWSEDGIDTTFSETPTMYKRNRTTNFSTKNHAPRSFQAFYEPNFFRDDEAESVRKRLLTRIEIETKAQLEHDVEYYEKTFGGKVQQSGDKLKGDPSAGPTAAVTEFKYGSVTLHAVKNPAFSRWKIGFIDKSINRNAKGALLHRNSLLAPPRTVIRTRRGSFRYANPAEERARSWRDHPSGIDWGLAKGFSFHEDRLLKPYIDVDRDDNDIKQKMVTVKERRKKLLSGGK